MECPECKTEMHSPIFNISLMEKLWKCPNPNCKHRLIERMKTDDRP